MDVDFMERNGNRKGMHHRLGGGGGPRHAGPGGGKVCTFWLEGRCNRHPCQFLHQKPDQIHHQEPTNAVTSKRALVWKNPNASSGGGYQNGPSKWGKSYDGAGPSGERSVVPTTTSVVGRKDKICNFFIKGSGCKFGDSCKFLHSWFVGDDFALLTPLEGHNKVITGIALPSGSDKLYSGSKDGSVKIWDCQTGKCVADFNLGCEVGCLISEGPWVFVGIPNAVKAWNPQMGVDMTLDGPAGQVYALVVGNDFLFAAVQDGNILAWKVNAVTNRFEPAASLSGHRLAVVSLVVGGMRLYSGSMDNSIRVWDLTTLQCIQTLTDHTSVVMSVLCWEQFLLSCSLDRTVKVWVATETGALEVTYTHELEHGVLTLSGMHDGQGKPILLCACNNNTVYLYDLPSFSERGKIFSKEEIRAIQTGPDGLFFTGDGTGELKVWKWSTTS